MEELATYSPSVLAVLAVLIIIFRRQVKAWLLQAARAAQEPPAAPQAPTVAPPASSPSAPGFKWGGLVVVAFGAVNAGALCYGALAGTKHWAFGVFGGVMLLVLATIAYFGLRHR